MKIEVSIVTPTYNRALLLDRVWKSLKNQKLIFEWIVVDDGSTDNTSEVVHSLEDPRIKYVQLPRNVGVNAARNAGAKLAKGNFLIFLDSDDELYPHAMARMVQVLKESDPSIGAAFFACIAGNTGKQISIMTNGAILDEVDILCRNALKAEMILIYRIGVIRQYSLPEDLKSCEGLYLRDISKKYKFLMINEPGRIYHRQGDNISDAESIVGFSNNIAELYERILINHSDVLTKYPKAKFWHLKKMLYRYGVAGNRSMVWKTYRRIINQTHSPLEILESTAIFVLGILGSARFESWRMNFINSRFGH